MRFPFRTFLLLALVVATLPHIRSADTIDPKSLPPLVPYFRCGKEEADALMEIVTKLDSVFTEKREKIYFRRSTSADGGTMPTPFHMSADADGVSKSGKGIGYGYSILVTQTESGVEIAVQASWTLENEHGSSVLEVAVPYLSDRKGCAAGFTYSCVWTKMR